MSILDTRTAFTEALTAAITAYNTANNANVGITFDNDSAFDAGLYEIYVKGYLVPSVSDPLGKLNSDQETDIGFYQSSVFVKKANGNYDIDQLAVIDSIRAYFKANNPLNGIVNIADQYPNVGRDSGSWFVRDLTSNFYNFNQV